MVWALNSSNPKGTLLLAIGLLGSSVISGNLSAEVLVSKTGSGYASKHAALNSSVVIENTLLGTKLNKGNLNNSIAVDSSLLGKKLSYGNVLSVSSVNVHFEFTRPNYYFGSLFGNVNVTPHFSVSPRRNSDLVNGIFVYDVVSSYRKSNNSFNASTNISPNPHHFPRHSQNFNSTVQVFGDLNAITSLIYAEAACIHTNTYTPWVMDTMINANCGCKILLGQSVKIDCSIKDCDEVPIVPTELRLTVVLTTGQKVVKEMDELVVEEGVGNYSYSFVPEEEGIYLVRWDSSGNYFGVVESSFYVIKGAVQ